MDVNAPGWILFHLLSASRLALSVVVASLLLGGSLHSPTFFCGPFLEPHQPDNGSEDRTGRRAHLFQLDVSTGAAATPGQSSDACLEQVKNGWDWEINLIFPRE